MGILYVGIDLAKNVFAVHGVNKAGKPELVRPSVARAKLHELVASPQHSQAERKTRRSLSIRTLSRRLDAMRMSTVK